jgi:hypothetical protein
MTLSLKDNEISFLLGNLNNLNQTANISNTINCILYNDLIAYVRR